MGSVDQVDIALTVVGGLVLLLGLVSCRLRRNAIPEPLIALVVGILLGPAVTGLLFPTGMAGNEALVEEVIRLTLAVGLMGVALRLPRGCAFRHWRSLAVMLGPVMVAMWLVSGLFAFVLLGVSAPVALLLGAMLAPTDPVVASSILTGTIAKQHVPARLRDLISAESGLNDGLAFPFVFLPSLLLTLPVQEALAQWVVHVVLWQVLTAVLVGAAIGYIAGRLVDWAEARRHAEPTSLMAYALAIALLTLGVVRLMGSDGILAVFVAGLAFSAALDVKQREQDERIGETITTFFTPPSFVLIGLLIPWDGWFRLGWSGLLLAAAILLLRRLPVVLALKSVIGPVRGYADALLLGWFGPMGISALFYAVLLLRQLGMDLVWTVGTLVVCASILVHGVTATPFSLLYGRASSGQNSLIGQKHNQRG